ncbi:hypothetical protein BV392_02455 [Rhodovulum sulfidophilum]|nr:hypothetical protein BV392_02455 [Rhodovulum sulfidophilum]
MACAAARLGLLRSLAGVINRDDGDLPVCGVVAGKLPEEDRMPRREPERPGGGAHDRLEVARMRLFVEPCMLPASLGIEVCRGTGRSRSAFDIAFGAGSVMRAAGGGPNIAPTGRGRTTATSDGSRSGKRFCFGTDGSLFSVEGANRDRKLARSGAAR